MTTATTILLLLTTIPTIAFGQLKGEFCHNFGFGVECVTFLDSNKFEYSHNHCTGYDKGKGVYTIHGNNLTLQFQSDTTIQPKPKVLIDRQSTTSDTVTIEMYIFSLDYNEPLIAANAFIRDKSIDAVYVAGTDLDGRAVFKVPKSLPMPTINAQYIGHTTFSDTISLNANYKFTVYLPSDFGKLYNSTEAKSFKIKDIKKRSVSLKHDYKDAIYSTYEKR